jgi:hypothetical protein
MPRFTAREQIAKMHTACFGAPGDLPRRSREPRDRPRRSMQNFLAVKVPSCTMR